MLELVNHGAWSAGVFPGWNSEHRHQFTIVIKAGFDFALDGALTPLPAPPAIVAQDQFRGDPARTSLATANETVPFKQGGELLIAGTAYPMVPCRAMEVRVSLDRPDGRHWAKSLRVSGARTWRRSLLGALPSEAAPLKPNPLHYEYAYGGVDVRYRALEPRNPAGRGFIAGRRSVPGCLLPAIEYLDDFVRRPFHRVKPAGFGPLAPSWSPRLERASEAGGGTGALDGCPYPADPSPALFNVAPADQQFEAAFAGGEALTLRGFFPEQTEGVTLTLPVLRPAISLHDAARWISLDACLDTVQVDTDRRRLELLWRTAITRAHSEPRKCWVHISEEAVA